MAVVTAYESPRSRLACGLMLAAAGAWWLGLFLRFGRMWSAQADYGYGWAVPALALWLFGHRWKGRPVPTAEAGERRWIFITAALLSMLALMALLPVLEANPLWPTVLWPAALAAIGLTLSLLGALGGWPWVGNFVVPVGFILVALPWPAVLMQPLSLTLMRLNATLAAEVVTVLGRPAIVHGTVIEVATGWVGIDEACSGMRSLQAILMATLFFGEFYRFRLSKRAGMVFGGLVIAVLCNLARTTFLTWQVAVNGLAAMTIWHDRAGDIELAASLAGVLGLALLLNWKNTAHAEVDGEARQAADWRRVPTWLAVCLLAAYVMAEAGTQAWYSWHEKCEDQEPARWQFRSPVANPQPLEISAVTREILHCDFGEALTWADGRQHGWAAYFFRWQGGVASRGLPAVHSPEVCLPAAGARLRADLGSVTVKASGADLTFRVYRFTDNGRQYHVFFCLWDFRDGKPIIGHGGESADLTSYRLGYVFEGRRRLDFAELEVVLVGASDDAEAVRLFREMVPEAVVPVG